MSDAGANERRRDEVAGAESGARSEQSGAVSEGGAGEARRDEVAGPGRADPSEPSTQSDGDRPVGDDAVGPRERQDADRPVGAAAAEPRQGQEGDRPTGDDAAEPRERRATDRPTDDATDTETTREIPVFHDADTDPDAGDPAGPTGQRSPQDTVHTLRYVARSDRGLVRATNQDSVFAGNRLLVIADGMGGHAAGDTASRLVVAAFAPLNDRAPAPDLLGDLVTATREGNGAIAEMVAENPDLDGMGTTLTAMLFEGDRVGLAHVGDSRAYLYRSGILQQLTHDDTFVQSLVDDGRISESDAEHHPQRNLLLRALNGTELDPSLTLREARAGDRYLLCSDGLSGVVGAEAIADTLAEPDPERTADLLIQRALLRGGPDNVTVIVADVIDTGVVPVPGPVTVGPEDPEATGPIQRMTREMPRIPLPPIPEEPGAPAVFDHDGADLDEDIEDEADDDFGYADHDDVGDDLGDGDGVDHGTGGDGVAGEGEGTGRPLAGAAAGVGLAAAGASWDDRAGVRGRGNGRGNGAAAQSGPGGPRGPGGPGHGPADASSPWHRRWRRRWQRRGALTLSVVVLVLVALAASTLWVRSQYYVGAQHDRVAVFRGVNGSLLGLSFSSFQEDSCAGQTDCQPIKISDLEPAARNQVLGGIQAGSLTDARSVISRLSGQLLPPCPSPEATSSQGGSATGGSAVTDSSGSNPTSGTGTAGSTRPGSPTSGPGAGATGVGTAPTSAGTTRTTGSGAAGVPTGPSTIAAGGTAAGAAGLLTGATPPGSPTGVGRGSAGADRAGGAGGAAGTPVGGQRAGALPGAAGTATPGEGAGHSGHGTGLPGAGPGPVTVVPAPTTVTVQVTVTLPPVGLFDRLTERALLAPTASPHTTSPHTTSPPTTRTAAGTPTSKPTGTSPATTTSSVRSTVTSDTPTVTVTQTVTTGPTLTGTPLAPAPAEPGITCRVVG